jgi:hypothetical protein
MFSRMVPNNLVVTVTDGDKRLAEVIETYEHYGHTIAHVAVQPEQPGGSPIEGFVEVPDNPETPAYKLHCTDCGHTEVMNGKEQLVDSKDVDCQHEGNARLLKRIHEAKRPSHSPTVTPQPA